MKRFFAALRDERGVAAIEFALIVPILAAFIVLGIDGWTRINQTSQMRSAVQTGARYYQGGGSDDTAAAQLALASWNNAPHGAQVTTARSCTCGGAGASCSSLCAGQDLPQVYVTLTATGGFSDLMTGPTSLTQSGTVRVR
jgi:Flp pilus assembly protein TadG